MSSCHIQQHTEQPSEKNEHFFKVLNGLCYINLDEEIILNYDCFKHIGNSTTYYIVMKHIIDVFETCLMKRQTLNVHLYIKSITLSELDKHLNFIKFFAETLKNKFPDKLEKCFIYDASFMFAQLYNIISCFIDKNTQHKIQIIKNSS